MLHKVWNASKVQLEMIKSITTKVNDIARLPLLYASLPRMPLLKTVALLTASNAYWTNKEAAASNLGVCLSVIPATVKNLYVEGHLDCSSDTSHHLTHICTHLRRLIPQLSRLHLNKVVICDELVKFEDTAGNSDEELQEFSITGCAEHFTTSSHPDDGIVVNKDAIFKNMQTFVTAAAKVVSNNQLPNLKKFVIVGDRLSSPEEELCFNVCYRIDVLNNQTAIYPMKTYDSPEGEEQDYRWMRYQKSADSTIHNICKYNDLNWHRALLTGHDWSCSRNMGVILPRSAQLKRPYHDWQSIDTTDPGSIYKAHRDDPESDCLDIWFWEKCLSRTLIKPLFYKNTTVPNCLKRRQPKREKDLRAMMVRVPELWNAFGDEDEEDG